MRLCEGVNRTDERCNCNNLPVGVIEDIPVKDISEQMLFQKNIYERIEGEKCF